MCHYRTSKFVENSELTLKHTVATGSAFLLFLHFFFFFYSFPSVVVSFPDIFVSMQLPAHCTSEKSFYVCGIVECSERHACICQYFYYQAIVAHSFAERSRKTFRTTNVEGRQKGAGNY